MTTSASGGAASPPPRPAEAAGDGGGAVEGDPPRRGGYSGGGGGGGRPAAAGADSAAGPAAGDGAAGAVASAASGGEPAADGGGGAAALHQQGATHDGWDSYQVADSYFTVPRRYRLRALVGKGRMGTVCDAHAVGVPCEDGGEFKVAIKRIAVPNCTDEQALGAPHLLHDLRRALREVSLLAHFDHDNIIRLFDLFEAPPPIGIGRPPIRYVYAVTELLDTDLSRLLENYKQGLTAEHCQWFGLQLFLGLHHIHAAGVIHRDLKPCNIVVNEKCDLKIVDFGLARDLDQIDDMTDYVVTRWYRPPELLMQSKQYTPAVDMWSAGCVLAECALGHALFPGREVLDQLDKIFSVVGTPTLDTLQQLRSPISEKARKYVTEVAVQNPRPARDLREVLQGRAASAEDDALPDLLSKLLRFDPAARVSALEAVQHPWLESYYDEDDPPATPPPFVLPYGRVQDGGPAGDSEQSARGGETSEGLRAALSRVVDGFAPRAPVGGAAAAAAPGGGGAHGG